MIGMFAVVFRGGITALMAVSPCAAETLALIPLPRNAYISLDGLDWAWGGPCPAKSDTCGVVNLSFQAQFGWRLPSPEEMKALHPSAFDFVFPGANVPDQGTGSDGASFRTGAPIGDAACAAPYFNEHWSHCDWLDGMFGNWDGLPTANPNSELLVVRPSVPPAMSGLDTHEKAPRLDREADEIPSSYP